MNGSHRAIDPVSRHHSYPAADHREEHCFGNYLANKAASGRAESLWSDTITRLTSQSFGNARVGLWKVLKESKNCGRLHDSCTPIPGEGEGAMKIQRLVAGESVSRILCAALARGVTIIPLGLESLRGSSSLPEGRGSLLLRACCVRAGPALPSYLALLHAGFAVPRMLPSGRWALTPPFHPYQMMLTETGGPVVSRWPAAEVCASPAV